MSKSRKLSLSKIQEPFQWISWHDICRVCVQSKGLVIVPAVLTRFCIFCHTDISLPISYAYETAQQLTLSLWQQSQGKGNQILLWHIHLFTETGGFRQWDFQIGVAQVCIHKNRGSIIILYWLLMDTFRYPLSG